MKKLRIPEESEDYIDFSEISIDFKGLLIGYKNSKPVGYFQHDIELGVWYFMTSINMSNINPDISECDNLLRLVKDSLRYKVLDEIKVIEFV